MLETMDLRKYGPQEYLDRVVSGMTRKKLYQQFAEQGFRSGAEIGVADGRNALTICEAIPEVSLLCVDPWLRYNENARGGPQSQHAENKALAAERLKDYKVKLVQDFSMGVVKDVPLGSIDFVYIDGNHAFDYVMQDLIEWSKRVRKGGIVAGHDFYHFKYAGVVEAVVAYTGAHGITDWHVCDEREPSFWWVKP